MARLQQELKDSEARLRDVIAMKGQEASQSILSSRVQVGARFPCPSSLCVCSPCSSACISHQDTRVVLILC